MNQIRAVLLDIDGTLIDSNDAHARSWVEAAQSAGVPLSFELVRPLIGMGGDQLLPTLLGLSEDEPLAKRITAERAKVFRAKELSRLHAFDGARELLQRFRAEGFKMVVGTSSDQELVEDLLSRGGLTDLIDAATSKDDVSASKPEPDLIRAALEKAGVSADQAIMLGDTPYDIQAANRAGVRTIAFECGGWERERLSGALAVYTGPRNLLENYEASPFGDQGPGGDVVGSRTTDREAHFNPSSFLAADATHRP